jgi:hypothetical protein
MTTFRVGANTHPVTTKCATTGSPLVVMLPKQARRYVELLTWFGRQEGATFDNADAFMLTVEDACLLAEALTTAANQLRREQIEFMERTQPKKSRPCRCSG